MPRTPSALQQTIEAIQSGRRDEAERLAAQLEENNTKHRTTLAPGYLLAESDLSRIYTALGQFNDAILVLRRALSIPRTPSREDLLCKLQTNLAELLLHAGRSEEARDEHQDCLARRTSLYGENSLGVAMGEAPFAEMLFLVGALEEAEQRAGAAMAKLLRARASQVAPVIALRAAIRAARYHDDRPLLEPLRLFAGPPRHELLRECLHRATRDEPRVTCIVLDELRERWEDSRDDMEGLSSIITALRKVNSVLGAHQRSASLIEWQLQHLNDEAQALGALLSLALEKSEAGDLGGALRAIQTAKQRAPQTDLATQVRVFRNEGRILTKSGDIVAAEASYQSAIRLAETLGGALLGGALVGRALFAHHRQEASAAELFERAMELLPPTHPDAIAAKAHLRALALRVDCGCALAREVEREVRSRLPLGLLARIIASHSPTKRLHAEFLSPPTHKEKITIEQAINRVLTA